MTTIKYCLSTCTPHAPKLHPTHYNVQCASSCSPFQQPMQLPAKCRARLVELQCYSVYTAAESIHTQRIRQHSAVLACKQTGNDIRKGAFVYVSIETGADKQQTRPLLETILCVSLETGTNETRYPVDHLPHTLFNGYNQCLMLLCQLPTINSNKIM